MNPRWMIRLFGILLTLLLLPSSCAVRTLSRNLTPPTDVRYLDLRAPYLKAHMKDGRVYVLTGWKIDEAAMTVSGSGDLLDANRKGIRSGTFDVPIDSVSIFETNETQMAPAVAALTVVTVVSAGITLYCIANPKACFGSCPTFYAWDGERMLLQAEGFSASVSPSMEATDLDALYRMKPAGRDVQVRMTNEALETHVVRSVRLLVAPRLAGGRVLATPDGEFWQATAFQEPTACAGREGDCLAAVRAFDGIERFSRADSADLARRETIDLTFPGGLGDHVGLVLASRQTLLSTFLFYQTLAYMGRDVGSWIATLERSGAGIRKRSKGIGDALGGIEILAEDPTGRLRRVADVRETGPLATDVRVVPLPRSGSGPLHVRLRLTRGLWRLDYLALARLDAPVRPIAIEPGEVVKDGSEDRGSLARLLDPARVLTTFPGDQYTLSYRLPDEPDRCEIFLESRGYYLEWMREEWLPERNPSLAMAMFRNPRKALRTLAPEFKRIEAGMEKDFWRSRYVHP